MDDIQFVVQTAVIDDNRRLISAKKNEEGYYEDVPVIVLNTVTRNATEYSTKSILAQINTPGTAFNTRLTEGTLFGEWGHPFIDVSTKEGMRRLVHLEPKDAAFDIGKVSCKSLPDLGINLITMSAKPNGPNDYLYERYMTDPTRNLAHSLRSVSNGTKKPNGVISKDMVHLVTIDAGMASGGFKAASKRYMADAESLGVRKNDFIDMKLDTKSVDLDGEAFVAFYEVALESFSDTEVNDLFKRKSVTFQNTTYGLVKESHLVNDAGVSTNLLHEILKSKRG